MEMIFDLLEDEKEMIEKESDEPSLISEIDELNQKYKHI